MKGSKWFLLFLSLLNDVFCTGTKHLTKRMKTSLTWQNHLGWQAVCLPVLSVPVVIKPK